MRLVQPRLLSSTKQPTSSVCVELAAHEGRGCPPEADDGANPEPFDDGLVEGPANLCQHHELIGDSLLLAAAWEDQIACGDLAWVQGESVQEVKDSWLHSPGSRCGSLP